MTSSVEASAPATGTGKYNLTGLTNPKVRPTVKTLNQMLDMALDPNVPNSEKTQLVEGSEKDPEVFNKLVQARKDNPDATYKIFRRSFRPGRKGHGEGPAEDR